MQIYPFAQRKVARGVTHTLLAILALPALFALTGCSTGSANPGPTPTPQPGVNTVTGRVTDAEGAPIIGVTVEVAGETAVTTQFGNFRVADVNIPAGEISLLLPIEASRLINGVAWSGSNTVEVFRDENITHNINIVLSPTASQGAISGIIRNAANQPLGGASIYARRIASQAGGVTRFFELGSFLAVSANDGTYRLPDLPSGTTYQVTVSSPGRQNATVTNLAVNAAQTVSRNFTLQDSTFNGRIDPTTALTVDSFTLPVNATRAAGKISTPETMGALREYLLARRGKKRHRLIDSRKVIQKASRTRSHRGYNIENVLLWDYEQIANLYGHLVLRAANNGNYVSYAILQDALADRFSDAGDDLLPNVPYDYSLSRLNTVTFPFNGDEGDPSPEVRAGPFNPITLTAPTPGARIARPIFTWNPVTRANIYAVLLYDRLPVLQSDNNQTDGVRPIWTKNVINGTSTPYDGPNLDSGATYYWTVIADDGADPDTAPSKAYAIGALQTFIVP